MQKGEEGKEIWREREGDDNILKATGDCLQPQTFSLCAKGNAFSPPPPTPAEFESLWVWFLLLAPERPFPPFLGAFNPLYHAFFWILTFPQQWHGQLQRSGCHQCPALREHRLNAEWPWVPLFPPASRRVQQMDVVSGICSVLPDEVSQGQP